MHYVRHGQGIPIILQHGWPEFWYVWCKNIPALSEHFDIIVPDLRGFSDSDKLANAPCVKDYVDDLSNLIEHLDLKEAGIVTHDAGAWITQACALRNTGRLKGLFFFNCLYLGIGRTPKYTSATRSITTATLRVPSTRIWTSGSTTS